MPEQQEQSRLAAWGSRPMTLRAKLLFWAILLVVVAGVGALLVAGSEDAREEYATLERQLNEHYEEPVSVRVISTARYTSKTIILDGVERSDCEATEDGYLECEDDPQPTPTRG